MYLNPNASVPSKPPSKLNKAAAAFTPSSYTAGIPPSQASAGGLSSSAVPRLQSPTPAGYSRVQSPLPHVTSPAYTWNMEMPSQGYAQPFFPIDQTAPHDAAAPTQAHRWGMGMPPQGYAQPFSTTDHMAPHDAAAPTQAHHWSMGMPNKGPPIEPEDSTAQMAPNAIVLPSPPSLEGLPPEIRAFLEHHQQMAQQMAQMINRQNGRIDRQNERIDRQTECIDRQTECIDRQTECIDELKDDVRHMMNAVVDYEYDITDRDATNHIREDVKKTFENRYPPKTPGGTARKRVKLSDLTEKELRKRKDLGSPEGPHWSALMSTKAALTSEILPCNKKLHKPVREHMENSYERVATSYKNFLRIQKDNIFFASPTRRGFEKLDKSFDVATNKTKYLNERKGKSRGTAIPPRVFQERTNHQH